MALKPALFLGLRPTQGSYPFKPFTTSKELREFIKKLDFISY